MWTLSMCSWAYSLSPSSLIILSPASIQHKAWGKSWHELNADLGSDKKKKRKKKERLSTA